MISGSSGNRPSRCFENTSAPSARTSNWLSAPDTAFAAWRPVALTAAARLAARLS